MKILQLNIIAESVLVDAFSDYLVGMHDAATEYSIDDAGAGGILRAFVEIDAEDEQAITALKEQVNAYGSEIAEIFSCRTPQVSVEVVANNDWAENWKAYFKPFAIVEGLVIAPTWEPYTPQDGERMIVMDPGMAFGTGHHATTRLCLEIMRDFRTVLAGSRVLDVGTGTGILAMAALLWGASEATAVDNDEEAVHAARINAERNNLSDRMQVSGVALNYIEPGYDLVIANIVHDVLVELSGDLMRVVNDDGYILLSGLIEGDQSSNLTSIFEQKGFLLKHLKSDDSWCALLFQKTG